MTLEESIAHLIAIKQGNKQLAIFYYDFNDGSPEWFAEIGNPWGLVSLGEASGEFSASGETALIAVNNLIDLLKSETPSA